MSNIVVRDGNASGVDVWDVQERPPQQSEPGGPDPVIGILTFVLRNRWWVVGGALLLAAVVVPLKLLTPRTYTSVSQFVPEGRPRTSELAGLAAQFGVAVESGQASYSPQFYIDLMRLPVILGQAVDRTYTLETAGGSADVNLVDHYRTHLETPERSRALAARTLNENIRATLSVKTNVVELGVKTGDPALSAQVNATLLFLLNRFNAESRQSRAAAERAFLETRSSIIAVELRDAEERFEAFLRANRQWENSPELRFTHDRHATDITHLRQVHTSIMQSYEQAKIDEIRDTPVLTIVQQPVRPEWPDARGTVRNGVLALVLGGLLGLAAGIARRELKARLRDSSPEGRQLRSLLDETGRDIRTLGLARLRRNRTVEPRGTRVSGAD
jgi:uncharacterized protein involved in exopolysaccharide biosynthesis